MNEAECPNRKLINLSFKLKGSPKKDHKKLMRIVREPGNSGHRLLILHAPFKLELASEFVNENTTTSRHYCGIRNI